MDHIKYNVHIRSVSFRRGRYLLVCQDQLLIVKLILGCICYIIFPIFLQLHSINDACIFGCCDEKKKLIVSWKSRWSKEKHCSFLEIEMKLRISYLFFNVIWDWFYQLEYKIWFFFICLVCILFNDTLNIRFFENLQESLYLKLLSGGSGSPGK